jgi:hypothetical protein
MSGFFDSEMVRESLLELDEMQEKLLYDVIHLSYYSNQEKKEHLQLMKDFLEKQKIFIFRVSLSNDPEAIEMKNKIVESAKMFGLKDNETIDVFFEKMEESLTRLEKTLDI